MRGMQTFHRSLFKSIQLSNLKEDPSLQIQMMFEQVDWSVMLKLKEFIT